MQAANPPGVEVKFLFGLHRNSFELTSQHQQNRHCPWTTAFAAQELDSQENWVSPFGRLLPIFWHWRWATASGETQCQLSTYRWKYFDSTDRRLWV